MASRLLKNVCVCLYFQIVSYQFVLCQIDKSTTSKKLDLDFSFLTPPVCGAWNSSIGPFIFNGVPSKSAFTLPWNAMLGYLELKAPTSWRCGGSLVSKRHVLTAAHCIHKQEDELNLAFTLPWNAMLGYLELKAPTSWRCGGSLVSKRHVLTAAHCIHKQEDELYWVRLGRLDIENDGESSIVTDVEETIIHEHYDVLTRSNDIALIVLDEDVEFTNLIQPICLPTRPDLLKESFVNYEAFVAGWGTTELNSPPERYRQITLAPVLNNSICAYSYSGSPTIIDERVMCLGQKRASRGPWNGDNGGPLITNIYNQEENKTYFYQIGIHAYSGSSGRGHMPVVYTRVTEYLPWIQTYMSKNID